MLLLNSLAVTLAILFSTQAQAKNENFKEIFGWKEVHFAYPNDTVKKSAIDSKKFIQDHNLPLGLEVYNDKLFITLPRWKHGIPATLTYVNLKDADKNKSPDLIPYPSWKANDIYDKEDNSSTKIVSTFRVRADECDRLWVMDTGVANILGGGEQFTPAKILVYDLKTDELIRSFPIKSSDIKEDTFFPNIVVDVTKDKCDDAHAYIPDLGSNALIVYSWGKNDTWRIKHHYFNMDPLAGNYHVAGVNFQWVDGLFGIALSPVQEDGYRTAYFHALSSTREFTVSTRVLQNATEAESYYEYKPLGSRGPNSQATASMIDEKSGVLFYTQVNKNGIGCWNSVKHANEYSADTNGLVSSDNDTMVFPNDLKVDRDSNLWVLTDKLPLYIYRSLDNDDVNFRIFKAPVAEVIKGTVCDSK
ncbi:protein yellow [Nilaparvata lugens]|uniref:protein yellow n=1 Tax=Nilaparvata lugens TaxID=108931 RepID=UPI00193D95FF|nr:protein yellow [Nilaparvata lugens]XP_039298406.1 protein yellow [Nilaparvata lugens]